MTLILGLFCVCLVQKSHRKRFQGLFIATKMQPFCNLMHNLPENAFRCRLDEGGRPTLEGLKIR